MKKWSKYLGCTFIFAALMLCPLLIHAVDMYIGVYLDGEMLEFEVPPTMINDRTVVPMRKIFEKLGASVEWESSNQTITANKNQTSILMQIGNKDMRVDGEHIELDVPPTIVDGSTMVPARAVAEAFGANVQWSPAINCVIINTQSLSYLDFPSIPDIGVMFDLELGNTNTTDDGTILSYIVPRDNFSVNDFLPAGLAFGGQLVSQDKDAGMDFAEIIYRTKGEPSFQWKARLRATPLSPDIKAIEIILPDVYYNPVFVFNQYVRGLEEDETQGLFNESGRMILVPAAQKESWKSQGWLEYPPYYGKELWVKTGLLDVFSDKVTDIYGSKVNFSEMAHYDNYIKITLESYDTSNITLNKKGELGFGDIEFDYNGGKYKMDFDLFYKNYKSKNMRFIEAQSQEIIDPYDWERIQNYEIFIGMRAYYFTMVMPWPDDIKTYNYGDGETEQWIYKNGDKTEYYYFRDKRLTSYQK